MSGGLADTSVLIGHESRRPVNTAELPADLSVSIVTIAELRAGVLAAPDTATRDHRLQTLASVSLLAAVPIDPPVAEAWARLRVLLREAGQRMPINDSWIAATAITLGVPVVTQDADYDVGLEELQVIHV